MNLGGIVHGRGRRLNGAWAVMSDIYLLPVAAICLAHSAWVGLGLWIVLFRQPQLALVAAIALSLFELLSCLLRGKGRRGLDLTDRANGLLSALAGTWIFLPADQAPALSAVMIAGTILGGLLLTFLAKDIVAKTRLPALVWPYCVIAFLAFTIFPQASAQSLEYFDWPILQANDLEDLPGVFLQSMGIFLFSPWPLSGLVIAFALLAWSPAIFLAGMTGWLAGVAVSTGLVMAGAPIFWEAASYNFFLSGAALGAVFFVPDIRGLFHAMIGGALAAVIAASLQVLLEYSAVSFLPIPFAVTLYCGLVLFSSAPFGASRNRVDAWSGRPESNRVTRDWLRVRWGEAGTPLVGIPLRGAVEITQGFDGALSHRGDWRHALDFQRPMPPGGNPEDRPSLWGESVFSPVAGKVVSLSDAIVDNPLGVANFIDNWGNHVILETSSGLHVLVGHLLQQSVPVLTGQNVGYSTRLGLVGNSGRSTVPHLHLQAQLGEEAGAPTRDFRLANYFECAVDTLLPTKWHASGEVVQGDIVMAAAPEATVRTLLSGLLPGRGIWTVSSDETGTAADTGGPLVLETSLTESGQFAIRQDRSASMTLAPDLDGLRLNALTAPRGSLVSLLARCLATIPYAAFPGLTWDDWIPSTFRTRIEEFLACLNPGRNAQIDHLVLRCEAIEQAGSPALVLTSRCGNRSAAEQETCEVLIVPQRGPVQVIHRTASGMRTYRQISFEPRER